MRRATLVTLVLLAACNDLRDFRGTWQGGRVGDAEVVRVGIGDAATLEIESLDAHGIAGRITVDGLATDLAFASLAGAEADALANLSFAGSPLRVYLAFVPVPDGGGDALGVIALYDDRRIELRLLRGGTLPLYAIYALTEGGG